MVGHYSEAACEHGVHWATVAKIAAGLVVAATLAILYAGAARAGYIDAGPNNLSDTRSLAELIASKKKVHIIYVHGIRAKGPGQSAAMLDLLRGELGFHDAPSPPRTPLDVGRYPAGATFAGRTIWASEEEWKASRPFVDHHWLSRADGTSVKVDEVNWWPLVFPLKCRLLMVPEHDLSGDDKDDLDLCRKDKPPFHNWITNEYQAALDMKQRGHAALINRVLKHQLMNWGLSDAVIVEGTMRVYFQVAMHKAFAMARDEAEGDDEAYVVMAESLGCFVVMDAMASSQAVRDVLDRTDDLYFFANQFALLELGRLDIPVPAAPPPEDEHMAGFVAPSRSVDASSPLDALRAWGAKPRHDRIDANVVDRPRQIIAFSDPSDLLTYRVPPLAGTTVVNVYDRNATRWFWLLANPIKAHTGHLANKTVWKILTRTSNASGKP